ncbi:hypothetical protein [Caldibacillus sp. 210928-DFI.2.22]|uniref:hypothetical protein n=1 Tax=Caldibacillus sp. 210928-DFI.2.22 TaxID=2883265 RepID=UPI001D06A9FB|nr:hypothetical protein [Caldibacillus sp. 210928-DFI.2.22]
MRTDLLSKRINRKTTSHMLRPFFDDELEALDYDLLLSKGSIDERQMPVIRLVWEGTMLVT